MVLVLDVVDEVDAVDVVTILVNVVDLVLYNNATIIAAIIAARRRLAKADAIAHRSEHGQHL